MPRPCPKPFHRNLRLLFNYYGGIHLSHFEHGMQVASSELDRCVMCTHGAVWHNTVFRRLLLETAAGQGLVIPSDSYQPEDVPLELFGLTQHTHWRVCQTLAGSKLHMPQYDVCLAFPLPAWSFLMQVLCIVLRMPFAVLHMQCLDANETLNPKPFTLNPKP